MAIEFPTIREPLFPINITGYELIVPMNGADAVTVSARLVMGVWASAAEITIERTHDMLDWEALATAKSLLADGMLDEFSVDTPWLRLYVSTASDAAAYVNLTVDRRNTTIKG